MASTPAKPVIPDHVVDANVRSLMSNILAELNRHYPAHEGHWHIRVDTRPTGGVIAVRNLAISGKMGFQVPISWIDSEFKNPVKWAGELLERYGMSREKNADVVDEINNLKRTFSGEAIHQA